MPKRKPTKIKAPIKLPPINYLRTRLDYDPDTGTLTWKCRPREQFIKARIWKLWNNRFAGIAAGCDSRHYRVVRIDSHNYIASRIIWAMMTGKDDPTRTIDHIDRNPGNNRWNNLRLATLTEQNWNTGLRKTNTSGKRGVYPHQGKWVACISVNSANRYLGIFNTVEDASAVYEAAARKIRKRFHSPT